MKRSIVSINLKKDEIVIKLSEEATQEEILIAFKKKITELKNYIKMKKLQFV